MFAKTNRLAFGATLAGLLLCLGPRTALAGDSKDGGFNFQVDPIVLQPFFTDVDTNSSKFEEYRDMRDGFTVPRLHLFGATADQNRWFDFLGVNLLRDDARYTAEYGSSGDYTLLVDHNIIPHRFGNGAQLLHSNTHDGIWELSDSTQKYLQGAVAAQYAKLPAGVNYSFLDGLLRPYEDAASSMDLGLSRARTRARLDFARLGNFGAGVDLKYESRKGERPYGTSFGFSNVTELPEPIDYDTTDIDFNGHWKNKDTALSFGYRFSSFQNHINSMLYDNPWRATDSTDPSAYSSPGAGSIGGAATARNALSPDNSSNLLYAMGRSKLGGKGWVSGNLSYNWMKQDEDFIPFSTNTAINPSTGAPFNVTDPNALPESGNDGDVRVLHTNLQAGTRFGRGGSFEAHWRRYDYNNQSSRIEFPGYVRFDAVWEEIPRVSVPYDYTRQDFGAELGYDIANGNRIAVGYGREMWDRSFREIEESHEDSLKLTFDSRSWEKMSLRAMYQHGKRSTDEYLTEAQEESFLHPEGINNQPGLRKYDEAERKFDAGNILARFFPVDKTEIAVGFGGRKDNYEDDAEMGLLKDRLWYWNVEFSYMPSDDLDFFVFGNRSDRETFQRARQSGGTLSTNPADDWEATLNEVTDTWGAGLNAKLGKKWAGDVMAQWNRANGDTDLYSPPGGTPNVAFGFPEYDDNEFWSGAAGLRYEIGKHASASFNYRYEDYTADRFQREGTKAYMPGTLTLNYNDGDYKAHILACSLWFSF